MPIDSRWFAALVVLALPTLIPARVSAESFGRIRTESVLLTRAFTTAFERSPTFRSSPAVRYLRVQILCEQQPPSLVAIVAHELQHVLEIASAPSVVDDRSFARLFRSIGFSNCLSRQPDSFETRAAVTAGERVRAELLHGRDPVTLAAQRVAESEQARTGH